MASKADLFINPHVLPTFSTDRGSGKSDPASVLAFHSSLPHYRPTPLLSLSGLSESLECSVYLKDESSRLGLPSFKILGASWGAFRAVCAHVGLAAENTSLTDLKAHIAQNTPGIQLIAATDGNHGRAVAYFAALLGVGCTIYVPKTLPKATVALIASEGKPAVIRSQGNYDDAVQEAASAAGSASEKILVQDTAWPGYETIPSWIVEGYGTMMCEIASQLPPSSAFSTIPDVLYITPVGVGSLASAVVLHAKQRKAMVLAVEPATAACLQTSLRNDKPVTVDTPGTIMSGMDCGTVSSAAWPLLRPGVDVAIAVSDRGAHEAVEDLKVYGVRAGPCGAAPLAALKRLLDDEQLRKEVKGKRLVLLCTEGEREYDVPAGKSNDTR